MKPIDTLGKLIFTSRWLQAPLYVGLIFVQGLYAWRFIIEVAHLLADAAHLTETQIMLATLGLIDTVLISNLLAVVIIGGYETFVSRLKLSGHPDEPEWLGSVNAGTMKIKLAMSLVSITSIHLLRSFIDVENLNDRGLYWQAGLVVVFVFVAWMTTLIDRASHASHPKS